MNLRAIRWKAWPWKTWALTIPIGLAGVALFKIFAWPLPWLLGPLFAGLAVSLLGVKTGAPKGIALSVRTVLGVAIGASFQPELIGRFGEMLSSLALVPLYVLAIAAFGYPYFRKVCGFDKPTAYFSAMPGGLQDMAIFGEEAGANIRALSLVHATRVLIIVSLLPFILTGLYGIDASQSAGGPPAASVPPSEMALMAVIAVAGWWAAKRVGLFGPGITGPMILAGAASLLGLIHFRPPAEVIVFAQFVIGMSIGSKYLGLTLLELRQLVASAVGYCIALFLLAFLFERVVVAMGAAQPLEAILAYAPGGQAEMIILAIVAGADVAFVALHHVLRVFIVILGAPLLRRLF
jgi:membrane AbrB-like protein